MDVLSHGLWARAVSKGISEPRLGRTLNPWAVFFWGVFPDLFAFFIPFVIMFFNLAVGKMQFGQWPRPEGIEPTAPHVLPEHELALYLYNWSHSFVIFALVFVLLYFIKKKWYWVMLGWPLHILCDIPTHSYKFFPTPAFWPIWSWKFDGFSWGTPWFMLLNYSALLLVFSAIALWRKKKNGNSKNI